MKSVAVFCGSSRGVNARFVEQARALGEALAREGIEVVYGGANIGLMGVVADAALSCGGRVTGVIPSFLKEKEIAHTGLTRMIEVDSMHERKTKMFELSDAVIALPGGFGTLDELFEMLTWAQLGLHCNPIAILNVNGFYDFLTQMVGVMVDQGLLRKINQRMLLEGSSVEEVLEKIRSYEAPCVDKWILPAHL